MDRTVPWVYPGNDFQAVDDGKHITSLGELLPFEPPAHTEVQALGDMEARCRVCIRCVSRCRQIDHTAAGPTRADQPRDIVLVGSASSIQAGDA